MYHATREKLQTLRVAFIKGVMANPGTTPENALAIGQRLGIPQKLAEKTIQEYQAAHKKPALSRGDVGKVEHQPKSLAQWKEKAAEIRREQSNSEPPPRPRGRGRGR